MSFYYATDGKKFNSKIEALQYKKSTGLNIGFYYYDDIYSKVDWKTEPPSTLDFYYKEQAQRLRDSYDYLILCYSGGYDSTNILETFFYNNIKLDKIAIVGAFSQDSYAGSDENHNGELYNNAFPLIQKLGLESITEVHDYTERFGNVESFSISQYASEWTNSTGAWFSPHNWWWKDAGNILVPKNLGSKRAAIIFGRDKPVVINKKFYFYDTALTSYGNIQSSDSYDIVNFYWDPNFTPILVKQLHVLKNSSSLIYAVEKCIYDLKNPLIFKSAKSKTTLLSLRDQYLLNNQNSKVYDLYMSGLKNMSSKIDPRQMRTIHSIGYSLV
jgi:hypothetical protein